VPQRSAILNKTAERSENGQTDRFPGIVLKCGRLVRKLATEENIIWDDIKEDDINREDINGDVINCMGLYQLR